jgi:hypothetical protein
MDSSNITIAEPLQGLLSSGPSSELGPAAELYAVLIGSWDIEAIDYEADGAQRTREGEWHFSWALEGRAVQDVFIVPRRSARSGSLARKGNRYGTTVRFYDPGADAWQITWINPVSGAVNRLTAHKEGDAIVQVGHDPDGTMRRWCFVDMTANSFRWTGEASKDDGKTWRLEAEFFGRRQGS